ncbi:DedA family protein [Thalassotalea insulae]|uniref:DedA family protein n=1 Tax=Thalassotalea insulae TaxID=2056778 RepID=UPI0024E14EEA|nr:DedA family protein [Thalassotalea insulae]
MIEYLLPFVEELSRLCLTWGPLIVIALMAIESSFIPFPSEIVIIPAGFMAARGEFYPGTDIEYAVALIVLGGVAGSLIGASINYFLSLKLGRPFLYRWGKYFFIDSDKLKRAESIFCQYGDLATFVCRLIPVVRQLISIPAGISKMNFYRFSIFTSLGSCIWVVILTVVGYQLGVSSENIGYRELLNESKILINENFSLILLGCSILIASYILIHKYVIGKVAIPNGE